MIDFIFDHAALIGLLFFLSTFIFIVIFSFNPKRSQSIEAHKYIPLAEEEQ